MGDSTSFGSKTGLPGRSFRAGLPWNKAIADLRKDVDEAFVTVEASLGGGAADEVTYDNSSSGLTATDVQAAIDEVDTNYLLDTTTTFTVAQTVTIAAGVGFQISIGAWGPYLETTGSSFMWTSTGGDTGDSIWVEGGGSGSGIDVYYDKVGGVFTANLGGPPYVAVYTFKGRALIVEHDDDPSGSGHLQLDVEAGTVKYADASGPDGSWITSTSWTRGLQRAAAP